jgi:nuclear transcription factor Y gamma
MDQVNLNAQGQPRVRAVPAAPRRYDGQNGNPHYDEKNGGHYGESLPSSL